MWLLTKPDTPRGPTVGRPSNSPMTFLRWSNVEFSLIMKAVLGPLRKFRTPSQALGFCPVSAGAKTASCPVSIGLAKWTRRQKKMYRGRHTSLCLSIHESCFAVVYGLERLCHRLPSSARERLCRKRFVMLSS